MTEGKVDDHHNLAESIKASLQKAEGIVSGYQKNHTLLLVMTIASSAGATAVAGYHGGGRSSQSTLAMKAGKSPVSSPPFLAWCPPSAPD